MEIKIKCKGNTTIPIKLLKDFQGNLKTLSESNYIKLKNELIKLGFCEPVSVWKNGSEFFILNGHQRIKALLRIQSEGIKIPQEIPASIVEAIGIKEAKEKLLALTSSYGTITEEGLKTYLEDIELEIADIKDRFNFPDINFDKIAEPSTINNNTLIFWFDNNAQYNKVKKFFGMTNTNKLSGKIFMEKLGIK